MSPAAGHTTTAQPEHSARASVPWPPWRHDHVARAAWSARRTATAPAARWPARRTPPGSRPFVLASTRTRRVRQARERRAQQRAPPGPGEVEGASRTTGPSPGGGSAGCARRLPQQRPDDAQPRRPAARVLEVRQRRHQRERARQRGVAVGERAQPEPGARLVVLAPPELEPVRHGRVERAPGPRAGARARAPRADGERRRARRRPGMHVGDERGHGHAAELGRERGRGGEDVRHRHVGRGTPRTAGTVSRAARTAAA